ncbi:reverse transcriptase domain-containing protein [Tanacetum coccineum]
MKFILPLNPGEIGQIPISPEGQSACLLLGYLLLMVYRISSYQIFSYPYSIFPIHIFSITPFGAARISHFEVLTRVLDLGPSVSVFRAFYTRIYSDGLFSFAKRFLSAPSCLSKPPDSIKNWADHFFWVDARVFPISVPLYTGGVLEKDPAPHLTARQEQAVQLLWLESHTIPFGENTFDNRFERPDRTDMGLLDYIRTADPRKVQAVEVQKGEEQVTLLESTKHCFVSLDAPAAVHQASGSGSGAGSKAYAPSAGETVVTEEDVGSHSLQKQPEKAKRKKLLKQSDTLPAKRLRIDHPSLASGTGGKTLASLRRTIPEGSLLLGPSSPADVHTQVTVRSSRVADAPVYTAADTVTSSRGKTLAAPTSDVGGSSQPETSEESADSFYETAALNSEDAKRWYIPRWNITNDSLLDDGFSCRTLICLGSEVRSRTEHELELKEKLRAKYDARGVLLREKDAEIARLKSLVKEKETESAEVPRLRDQVSVLAADKSFLSAEVSALKSAVSQKDTDISLLDSRASYLKSALDDSQAACTEAKNLISTLSSERDGLASEGNVHQSGKRKEGRHGNINKAIQEEVEKLCTKKSDFQWTKEAESAFKQMKKLIAELPTLTAPREHEELIMYLAAAKEAISAVLMTDREGKKIPVYFVSRALRGPEVNYTPMEKLVLALLSASKRRRLLEKWKFELEGYDIQYRPRTAIKGQILADFIVERPEEEFSDESHAEPETTTGGDFCLRDRLSCVDGSGAGLILTKSDGEQKSLTLIV